MNEPVFSPSDLEQPRAGRIRLGGRVVDVSSASFWLADAFASVRVELYAAAPVHVGEWLIVEGDAQAGSVGGARIVWREARSSSACPEEFARLLWSAVGKNLRLAATALAAVRRYFVAERFVEVTTPVRVPSPGLDVHVDAIACGDRYLITSPEYHMKRLVAAGMPRIFQVARASRADEAGALHEAEFTLVEWYRAFCDSAAVMHDTEQIVAAVIRAVAGSADVQLSGGRRLSCTPPFARITVREAFKRYAGVEDAVRLASEDEDRYFELLVGRVEPALATYEQPVFLCEYPLSQASLARPTAHDPTVAERFELYAAGVELCNGFGELTDAGEQRARLERERAERRARGRPVYPIDEKFLAALEGGLPPCSGNALGFDRLLMLACGAPRIADVQAFPQHLL